MTAKDGNFFTNSRSSVHCKEFLRKLLANIHLYISRLYVGFLQNLISDRLAASGRKPQGGGCSSWRKLGGCSLAALPWAGLVTLATAGTAILLTVIISPPSAATSAAMFEETGDEAAAWDASPTNSLSLVTTYLAFSLSGLLEVGRYFRPLSVGRSPHLVSMSRCLAYLVEAILLLGGNHQLEADRGLQLLAAFAGCLAAGLEVWRPVARVVTAATSLLQGTWLLHHHHHVVSTSVTSEAGWTRLYFAWHIITISVLYSTVAALVLRRTGRAAEDIEAKGDRGLGKGPADREQAGRQQFSSLRSVPGTTSTLVSVVSRPDSELDESFLQKQMPVYSNTMVPTTGLSVLPSSNSNHNNKNNISRDILTTTTAASSSLPPAAVSTPFDERTPRAAAAAGSTTKSPTPTAAAEEAAEAVLAVRTVQLASPAPSTASTATCSPDVGISSSAATYLLGGVGLSPAPWPPVVVEAEPVDRISPSEEYNTLSRHIQSVRASIKLKESRII